MAGDGSPNDRSGLLPPKSDPRLFDGIEGKPAPKRREKRQRTEREYLEVFRSANTDLVLSDKQSGIVLHVQQSHPQGNGPRHVVIRASSMDTESDVAATATKNYATGMTDIVLIQRKVR